MLDCYIYKTNTIKENLYFFLLFWISLMVAYSILEHRQLKTNMSDRVTYFMQKHIMVYAHRRIKMIW